MLFLTQYFRWISACWVHHAYWSSHRNVRLGVWRTSGHTKLPVYLDVLMQEARRMFINCSERIRREISSIHSVQRFVPKFCRMGHLLLLDISAMDGNFKRGLPLRLQPVRLHKLVSIIVNHCLASLDYRFRLPLLHLLRALPLQNSTRVYFTAKKCSERAQRCN